MYLGHFLSFTLAILITQVTLSTAVPRHGEPPGHDGGGGGDLQPVSPVPPQAKSTPAPTPTPTATPIATPRPSPTPSTSPVSSKPAQNFVQVSSKSHVASSTEPTHSPSANVLSHSNSDLGDSSRPTATFATQTATTDSVQTGGGAAADSTPPQVSAPSATPSRSNSSHLVVAIVVPLIFVSLLFALAFGVHRRNRLRNQKKWAGSHLPEVGSASSRAWPFSRNRDMAQTEARGRNTYAVGLGPDSDWNRSEAHLTAEKALEADADTASTQSWVADATSPTETASGAEHPWDSEQSEIGHDAVPVRAFHSDSPMHDEPALAESRPATLLQPVPLSMPPAYEQFSLHTRGLPETRMSTHLPYLNE